MPTFYDKLKNVGFLYKSIDIKFFKNKNGGVIK